MPDRDAYLAYLSSHGLSEDDVLPIANIEELSPEAVGALLAVLASKPKTEEDKTAQQALAEIFATKATTNNLLASMHEKLMDRLVTQGHSIPPSFAGVFPTSCFNAQCTRYQDGHLILLDNGCFEILEAANGILLSTWDQKEKTRVLAKVIRDYCDDGVLPDPRDLDPPGLGGEGSYPRLQLLCALTTSSEEFVIAHEYGHLVNSHLSESQPTRSIRNRSGSVEVLVRSKEQEYEADMWAVEALVRTSMSSGEDAVAIACAGAIVFLGVAILVEKYLQKRGFYTDTHPEATSRVYMVESLFEIIGVHKDAYIGRRLLELVGDTAPELIGDTISVPMLDRQLNSTLERTFDRLQFQYEKPKWLREFQ